MPGPFVHNITRNLTMELGKNVDLSHEIVIKMFINGYDFSNVTANCWHVETSYLILNKTAYNITFTSTCTMTVKSLSITRIIFDKTNV